MKIVLVCGSNANHKALANKVAVNVELAGLVIEKRVTVNNKNIISKVANKLKDYFLFTKIVKAWANLLAYYDNKYPDFPKVHTLTVANINSAEAIAFVDSLKPELIMVSGTSIIKRDFLKNFANAKIINLHTGLSPYIKGGPNCTNWCLAIDKFHLIGNTIMWIDAGIDSGNIITTEFVPLDGSEDLNKLQVKVMEHAHQLYLNAVKKIISDPGNVPSVAQKEITEGQLFLTKMWNDREKNNLLKNIANGRFRSVITSEKFKQARAAVKTVPLPLQNRNLDVKSFS